MQSEVDNVSSRVGNLTISPKPKHRGPSKSETKLMNLEDITKYNVNREYISANQPWPPAFIPRQYLPHQASKWYPPIFCLGVAMSLKETEDFARYLGLPLDSDDFIHAYGIPGRLSELCEANPELMLKRCDQGGGPGERIWVFSLTTNYDVSRGVNVNSSLRKYREIVKEAFGSSKVVGWWLEYVTNHTPSHWWWWKHRPEWIDGWDPEFAYDD